MTRIGTGLSIATALGCMVTLGAQTQPPPPSSTTDQRSAMSDKARDISVTGCLAKGADGRFTLTSAKMDSPSSSTASTAAGTSTTAGTTGTTSSPAGTTAATAGNAGASLVLTGSSDSDLEKHVGHKIQVTGKSAWDGMDRGRMSSGTAGTTGSTTATPTAGAAAATADQPRLDVQSVKMIAATCS